MFTHILKLIFSILASDLSLAQLGPLLVNHHQSRLERGSRQNTSNGKAQRCSISSCVLGLLALDVDVAPVDTTDRARAGQVPDTNGSLRGVEGVVDVPGADTRKNWIHA